MGITQNKQISKYFLLIISFCVSLIVFNISENATVHIGLLWSLTIVAIWSVDFDFFHPYFWFSLFFSLYSSAHAILWVSGEATGGYTKNQIFLPFIALGVVLFIVGPKRIETNIESKKHCSSISFLVPIIKVLSVLVLCFSLILHSRGYYSKVQMRAEGDVFFSIGVHLVRYLTFFSLLYIGKCLISNEKKYSRKVILIAIPLLMFTLFTSERDAIIRYGFVIVMLFFFFGIVNRKHLLILFPVIMVFMVLSVVFKHYFVRNVVNEGTGNLFYDFLHTDFYASGLNLQYLLDREWTKGYWGFKTLFTEIFNPLLVGIKKPSLDHWFNYEVHTGNFKGYAFTLVGTGYVIGGIVGVVLVFAIVGIVIKLMYTKCRTNVYWLATYIYTSSAVIFSIRQSLQSIPSSLFKHVLLSILVCVMIDEYQKNKTNAPQRVKTRI